VNRTICWGEVQKAAIAAPQSDDALFTALQSKAKSDAFIGCMAQHGYVAKTKADIR
jgi:hypothetical protein